MNLYLINQKYFILIIFIFLAACKKDKKVETLYPLSYLPVHPASWWKYIDENGDTVKQETQNDYVEHSYQDASLNGDYTDPVKVPYWNGAPVYYYSSPLQTAPHNPGNEGLVQVGYLSEVAGQKFTVYNYRGMVWREVANVDTSLVINGIYYQHVIRVNKWAESITYSLPLTLQSATYYAKDIGLVMEQRFPDSSVVLAIIDYHINR